MDCQFFSVDDVVDFVNTVDESIYCESYESFAVRNSSQAAAAWAITGICDELTGDDVDSLLIYYTISDNLSDLQEKGADFDFDKALEISNRYIKMMQRKKSLI